MGWRKNTWGMPDLWNSRQLLSIVPGLDRVNAPKSLGQAIIDTAPRVWSETEKAQGLAERMWNLVTFNQYLDPATEWRPVRILGAGGFGVAALYERRTVDDTLVDDIVIKTAALDRQTAGQWWIPREAHVMTQLDERDCESILYLRRWKAYRVNPDGNVASPRDYKLEKSRGSHWRFYLETCPFGDLDILRWRYIAWGQYLPEAFLWHCFKAFAMAAKTMAEGGFRHAENSELQNWDSYVLHTDIKPQNLFLGYEDRLRGQEFPPNYPVPKLADFGLAEVTYDEWPKNCARYFKRGTAVYYPPEVRTGQKMIDWFNNWANFPFLESNRPSDDHSEGNEYFLSFATHRITAASNIWALGLTLYMLMTMESSSTINKMIDNVTEVDYKANGNHFMTLDALRTRQFPDYDDELGALVHECLNLNPEKRPTAQELLTKIDSHLKRKKAPDTYDEAEKLYYKGNEINHMATGRFFVNRRSDHWWERFNEVQAWTDPDLEPLDPPFRPAHMHPDAVTSRKRGPSITISSDNNETVRGGVQLPDSTITRNQAKRQRGTRFPMNNNRQPGQGQAAPAGNRQPQPGIRGAIPPGRPQPPVGQVGGLVNRKSMPVMRRAPGVFPGPVNNQQPIPYRRRDPALLPGAGDVFNPALDPPIYTGRYPADNPAIYTGRHPANNPQAYTRRDPADNQQTYIRRDPADNRQAYPHVNIHQQWLAEQAAAAHANQRLNEGGDTEQRNAQGEFPAPVFHRGGYDLSPPNAPVQDAGGAIPPPPQDRARDSRGLGLDGAGDVTMKDAGGSSDRENGSPPVVGVGSAVSMAAASAVNFGARMFGRRGGGV